jgi:pilus assembly protein FimV
MRKPVALAKATLAVSAGMLAQAALAEHNLDDTYISAEPVASEPMVSDLVEIPAGEPDFSFDIPDETSSVAVDDVTSLDFDLGSTSVEPGRILAPDPEPEPEFVSTIGTGDSNALDFDLGVASVPLATSEPEPEPEPVVAEAVPTSLETEIIDFDLGTVTNVGAILAESESEPSDFSPDDALVMRAIDPMTSTFVGNETLVASDFSAEPEFEPVTPVVDFELDTDADHSSATVVNPDVLRIGMGEEFEPMMEALAEESKPAVAPAPTPLTIDEDESLEFDVRLTDSTVLGQPMQVPSYDIGSINLDLSADEPPPSMPSFTAESTKSAAIEAVPELPAVSEPDFSEAQREEVSTKLDLAKAYEEMGDLEGARELLQEVALEGPPDLVLQAREILDRIGE